MTEPRTVTPLRRARNQTGISRGRLAAASGVSESTIARLEKPDAPTPRVTTQRCLAAALKLPAASIWPNPVDTARLHDRAA